ncbi:MAG: TetR/AcrR family transcriptional regulator [Deltaproteobacteria bacterium]|nr:TetR/AcrR family transcriptional regulator [Deltaproteobacteria bacterium]
MKDAKRKQILDGAITVFSQKGYQYATIEEISREAGVSKGLVHNYFENKLDLLLSVILLLVRSVNEINSTRLRELDEPIEKLQAVFCTYADVMQQRADKGYWGQIVKEGLPAKDSLKTERQKTKLAQIAAENSVLQDLIDAIIVEGQQLGVLDRSLKPQVIRQIMGGASQMLYYGLALEYRQDAQIGYTVGDVQLGMKTLIEKFRTPA